MRSESEVRAAFGDPASGLSRRGFLKGTLAVGAALGGSSLFAACGGSSGTSGKGALDKLRHQGYVTVGFANENPYGFQTAGGKLTGEAPEVARAVFKRLGVNDIRGHLVPDFGSLIPGLQAGRYDLIAAGMSITPERCAAILFSDPDFCGLEALGVKAGNPKGLSDYASVAKTGAKLAVESGAVEQGFAAAAGVKSSHLLVLDSPQALVQAVLAGRADAFSLTDITVNTLVKTTGGKLEALKPFVPVVDGKPQYACGGYGFRKSDQDLRDAFNTELDKMKAANQILPIVEPFGFTAVNVNMAKQQTAARLCKG